MKERRCMARHHATDRRPGSGPSQRQLKAGELVRHVLVDILRHEEIKDEALAGVSVTITEVRMSPDLKQATCFVEPLGGANADEVTRGLNRAARFVRGRLGQEIELRFTPELTFVHDPRFDAAERISRLLAEPRVRRDLETKD
jgi:ribosome-binding factor A